jgi:hypothetical protein
MRRAINDNPIVQVGVLAVLALVVGFVLLTQMGKGSSTSSSSSSPSPTASSAASAAPADSSATTAPPADSTPTTPSTSAPAAPAPSAASDGFVAGPGLPAAVVNAYKANKVVVLLVVRHGGIDDDAVKASVEGMAGLPQMALFVTNAGHVSRYSRITEGVNLDRVPALIVLRPSGLTKGGTPQASVSYGFRSANSAAQAIRDALYAGRTDLPYSPR